MTWWQYCTDSEELARYYRAAELLVHPGVQETFGLTALESQACGTPVVGIRGSYMDRIIFGEPGTLGARKFRDGAGGCGRGCCGGGELRETGLAAAESVREHYAWPVVFAQLFQLYARCARRVSRRLKRAVACTMQRHLPCEKRSAH